MQRHHGASSSELVPLYSIHKPLLMSLVIFYFALSTWSLCWWKVGLGLCHYSRREKKMVFWSEHPISGEMFTSGQTILLILV